MKISKMTTDQAADVLVRIADPATRIMSDDEVQELFQDTVKDGVENQLKGWARVITKLVPFCLKKHKEDVYAVIAALEFKTPEEVGGWPFLTTVRVLKESFDRDLIDFFKSTADASTGGGDK